MRIERIYDRKDLIDITTTTVLHNMVFGIVLIFLLQWVFLGNLRSALIVGATIPFALFFAVGILVLRGESANLLSVGAIDFGLIVDATVIMVESIFRRLGQATAPVGTIGSGRRWAYDAASCSRSITRASDVNRSIFFAAGIIIAGFIPLFTLSGVEGHIFGPMAKTYAYALAGGLLATFTVTPALSAILLPEHVQRNRNVGGARAAPHLHAGPALRRRQPGARRSSGAVVLLVLAGVAVRSLGLGIPAQARRRQSLDPRHHAVDHLARGRQRLRQPHARGDSQLPGGRDRSSRSTGARTTAPTPPASSTPSSSCR